MKIPPIFKSDLIKKLSRLTKKTFCPRPKFSISNTRHKGEKTWFFINSQGTFFVKRRRLFYSIYAILFSHPNSFTQHFFLLMEFFCCSWEVLRWFIGRKECVHLLTEQNMDTYILKKSTYNLHTWWVRAGIFRLERARAMKVPSRAGALQFSSWNRAENFLSPILRTTIKFPNFLPISWL